MNCIVDVIFIILHDAETLLITGISNYFDSHIRMQSDKYLDDQSKQSLLIYII